MKWKALIFLIKNFGHILTHVSKRSSISGLEKICFTFRFNFGTEPEGLSFNMEQKNKKKTSPISIFKIRVWTPREKHYCCWVVCITLIIWDLLKVFGVIHFMCFKIGDLTKNWPTWVEETNRHFEPSEAKKSDALPIILEDISRIKTPVSSWFLCAILTNGMLILNARWLCRAIQSI